MSLFAELKRRNVFRVGFAYVVTSWLVAQVGQVAAESFEAPAWVMKMFITFLALGFPFALLFAWAYELTPEGIKKEKDVDRSSSITHTTGRKLDFAIIAVLVVALGYFAWDRFYSENTVTPDPAQNTTAVTPDPAQNTTAVTPDPAQNTTAVTPDRAQHESGAHSESSESATANSGKNIPGSATTPSSPPQKSIAVLPFTNTSAGQENTQFFSDGIHDDLLTTLSKLHELKVISRTSVMAYRDTTRNMRQIGEELGVANLLEGRVQQAGNRVRINVQLISAQTDEHLWAETYDREVTTENIFDIQGEISRAIAVALEATLNDDEINAIGVSPTKNLEAYEAVLMARQLRNKGGFKSLIAATDYAQRAIDLDPAFADAYLELASALAQGINTGLFTDEETGSRITMAIDTAMSIQPGYGAAWSALGRYQAITKKPQADASLEMALRIDPGSAENMIAYGFRLQITGRPNLALPLFLNARELDPLSQTVLFGLGRTYDVLEDYKQARENYARIRAIDPSSTLGFGPAAGTYFPEGQIDQAINWIRKALDIDPDDFEIGGWMVSLFDSLNDHAAAGEWSDWLDSWVTNQPMPMAMQASHHYMTGDFQTAVQLSNLALRLELPDRWGSDAIFMRIKRDEAIATGEPEIGIAVIGTQHPGLLASQPEITPANMMQAVDLAQLLKLAGRIEESRQLLESVIKAYDQPYFVSGSIRSWLVPAKAEALTLLGDGPAALLELRRIIDKGWRIFWRWETELNANFDGIRQTSEFQAMVAEIQADMTAQRAHVQAMIENGEIPPPPEMQST